MSRPRFLLDENMPHAVREALGRVEHGVDVQVMGEAGSPPLETEEWRDRLIYLPLAAR